METTHEQTTTDPQTGYADASTKRVTAENRRGEAVRDVSATSIRESPNPCTASRTDLSRRGKTLSPELADLQVLVSWAVKDSNLRPWD